MKKAIVKITAMLMLVAFTLTALVACGNKTEDKDASPAPTGEPAATAATAE